LTFHIIKLELSKNHTGIIIFLKGLDNTLLDYKIILIKVIGNINVLQKEVG